MKNHLKIIETIAVTILIIFGLFLAYQIIKKALGGSWTTESIIISLLIFNLACVFTIGLSLAKLSASHIYLNSQFKSLATDFKHHITHK